MTGTHSSVPSLIVPGAADLVPMEFTPDVPARDRGRLWLPGDDDGYPRYRHRGLNSGAVRRVVLDPHLGPLVVYPSGGDEDTDYIKIDPANQKIEAAGTARPTRTIPLHVEQYVDGASASETSVMSITTLHDARSEAVLLTPFESPSDMDLAEAWSVVAWIAVDPSVGFPPFTAKTVEFEIRTTVLVDGSMHATVSVTGGLITKLFDVSTRYYRVIMPANGSSSFAAGVFASSQQLTGIEVRRRADSASDTLNGALAITGFTVEYTATEIGGR